MPLRKLISLPEVIRRTGFSRRHIYRLRARGLFPASRKAPGGRRHMFFEDEIANWMEDPNAAAV